MTQKPIFYDDDKLAKLRTNKKDAMIQNTKKKNEIIKDGLKNHKKAYSEIIEKIKTTNIKKTSYF